MPGRQLTSIARIRAFTQVAYSGLERVSASELLMRLKSGQGELRSDYSHDAGHLAADSTYESMADGVRDIALEVDRRGSGRSEAVRRGAQPAENRNDMKG